MWGGVMPDENVPADLSEGGVIDDSVSEAISAIRQIESFFDAVEDGVKDSANTFDMPFDDVFALIPERYRARKPAPEESATKVRIIVAKLFDHLARGRVAIFVSKLSEFMPADIVTDECRADSVTEVVLPLAQIVACIDPSVLREHMTKATKTYKVGDLPDPFDLEPKGEGAPEPSSEPAAELPSEPEPVPPPVDREIAKEPEPLPVPDVVPEPPAPPPVPDQPIEVAPPLAEEKSAEPPAVLEEQEPIKEEAPPSLVEQAEEPVKAAQPEKLVEPQEPPLEEEASAPLVESKRPEPAAPVRQVESPLKPIAEMQEPVAARIATAPKQGMYGVSGTGAVNLNTATREQLLTLDGVTHAGAEDIIKYREQNGPFRVIFDLFSVPGLGRKTFKRITGMPYSEKRQHRARKLVRLLDVSEEDVSRLAAIAEGLTNMPGFAGCVISDEDGLMLVESRAEVYAEPLSAIVSRMLAQVKTNLEVLKIDQVDSISIGFEERMLTIVPSGRIFLTAVHERSRLTKSQLSVLRQVADELVWLLSHRGYVG